MQASDAIIIFIDKWSTPDNKTEMLRELSDLMRCTLGEIIKKDREDSRKHVDAIKAMLHDAVYERRLLQS